MKTKILTGMFGLLLASSTMFAGWGVGFGAAYVGPPAVAYVAPVHGYYHHWPQPYVGAYVAPAPYAQAYLGPAPFYGAVWFPGRWVYGPHGRYWAGGYWGHRR